MNMKVQKISSKLIKPHTPTPLNLKNYYISFLDQRQLAVNQGVLIFYESNSTQLEESLAKTLVQFYPLAGRYIKNDHLVDCSDQGAEFVEAEAVDVELMELVAKTECAEQIKDLFPDHYFLDDEAPSYPLLSIQATHFPCGGVAIGISISHRVFDVSSLDTFIVTWSNASKNIPDKMVGSEFKFDLPSLLPYNDCQVGVLKKSGNEYVLKRFVFNNEALTALKSSRVMRPNSNGRPISRVRVVCAVIAKALIGLDRAKQGKYRDFVILQSVNMRERTLPPQPKHACGNLSISSATRRVAASEAEDIGMEELVDIMGDAVRKCIGHHAGILSLDMDGREIIANTFGNLGKIFQDSETNVLIFSDWSKFGFYDADFGWGKPVWTSTGLQRVRSNFTVLMSNKEGGIEAWLHLNQNDMSYFEQDEEIKLFTT